MESSTARDTFQNDEPLIQQKYVSSKGIITILPNGSVEENSDGYNIMKLGLWGSLAVITVAVVSFKLGQRYSE